MLHHTRRAALLAVVLLGTACSTDSAPTGVPSADPAAKKASSKGSVTVTAELRAREQSELARVRAEGKRNDALFVGLKKEFVAGKKEHRKGSPVLICDPMKYAAEVRIVGPAGGELTVGPHRLSIPAGALREPTVITAEAPTALLRELRFSPHGTRFDVAPTVTMNYKGCTTPVDQDNAVVYLDDNLDVLEWPRATDGKKGEVVSFIWHFSRYALAQRSGYATSW